ncbi:hypothetical protein IC229_27545 [Spirosoma sp. BT702]|uniref:Uncharacterized protein n=1 Tax=Spirosoma profusum TaxID=2771354 RepID=A0A927AST8_9BACT|nr:hypothetical protein [Spirosoma profusum]MBD2704426.1 hypothetical protein [Spirosoma profusum]
MSNIIRLYDHKAQILPSISPLLLTRDICRVVDEMIKLANKKKLVDHSDFAEVVGVLADYEYESEEADDCGGYCDIIGKRIVVTNSDSNDYHKVALCHELGHSIQVITGHYDKRSMLLSDLVSEEQQADTIGYYLLRGLYPATKPNTEDFQGYFSVAGMEFLNNWYDGFVQNDLFKNIDS